MPEGEPAGVQRQPGEERPLVGPALVAALEVGEQELRPVAVERVVEDGRAGLRQV